MPYEYTKTSINYQYVVAELLTNKILAEIPFKNVSFTRALRDAGQFQGDVVAIEQNDYLDLYENTMPGRTALYILRDGVCVWGGIIWNRSYNIKDSVLSVGGSEFTSYLYKRVAWKTWNQELDATVSTAPNNQLKVSVVKGGFNFIGGMPVQINFTAKLAPLTDFYTVADSPSPTSVLFYVPFDGEVLPDGIELEDEAVTISVQVDTYDYLRRLLSYVDTDFYDIQFPNNEIAPEFNQFINITSYSRSGGVATVTTDGDHTIIKGQAVDIRGLPVGFSYTNAIVLDVPTSNSFTYESLGVNVSTTTISGSTQTITAKEITALTEASTTQTVTLTTSTAHNFLKDNIVVVSGVDGELDGTYIITAVGDDNTTFSYETSGLDTVSEIPETGSAVSGPTVRFSTYGSYTYQSDLDIEIVTPEDADYSNTFIKTETLRGGALTNIGDHLDNYSNQIGGFEYRIDCEYDSANNIFKKKFIVIPLEIPDAPEDGSVSPIERFGAEKLVFEYPGNILEASMEENANDSATRFWVQGKNESGVNDIASEPYAGVSATGMLSEGWPVLDEVETNDSPDEYVLGEYAFRYLEESLPPQSNISITVNGSMIPEVGKYSPGDWCSVYIEDPFVQLRLKSGLEPRDTILVRKIDAYTVTVPDTPTFPESVQLELVRESQVDKVGY